ncbi:MFS transporter [Brevibacillus fulvus]|uniref:MFS family arabinose efflux permease n=1 Tax=Brevibacillus fulvus TaxID=1125967 RepID=A0A939BNG7_9BACL|nr:MFS transporter [Brevibacillus fulvus]MBM7589020.1 putative MFS family arabinose efflux permease [Brevibacillus fulvus]
MATTCGLAVANLYYNQPLLADMGRSFHANAHEMGYTSMLTQVGYAVGMFLFVPLGDIKERRRLITLLLFAVAFSLVGVATAQNLLWVNMASLLVGFTTVVPQVIVPLAAQMAPEAERGKVIGTVMSGLLFGILLARTVAGFVGGAFGWRSMYWIAAILMLALAIILWRLLPKSLPEQSLTYGQLLKSMGQLVVGQPILREASLMGGLLFGGFSVFWTSLSFFLEGAPYHYSSEVAGLFGLVGVVGALAAPYAGRLADRYSANIIVGIFVVITLLSYLSFGLWGIKLWGLVLGVILLDLGVQGAQITNQARIYSLVPEARNRLNTVFMVTYFVGGAIGSSLGSYAWSKWQWAGVCLAGSIMILLSLLVWSWGRLSAARSGSH